MDEMTKVRYLLMIQINDLRTLDFRGLNMIWRLAKDHDLPKFWPYGRLKSPKIENETSKNIVLLSFRQWTKITGRHEQVYFFEKFTFSNFRPDKKGALYCSFSTYYLASFTVERFEMLALVLGTSSHEATHIVQKLTH